MTFVDSQVLTQVCPEFPHMSNTEIIEIIDCAMTGRAPHESQVDILLSPKTDLKKFVRFVKKWGEWQFEGVIIN